MDKNDNREGSTRQLKNGSWECITQAKYLNPKTANPKRFKRTAKTEKEARRLSIMARDAWEKEYERGKDIKVDKKKTFGEYMDEYIETEVKPTVAGSTYHSYVNTIPTTTGELSLYWFSRSNITNGISGVETNTNYGTILTIPSTSNNYGVQFAFFNSSENSFYFRKKNGGTWNTWKKIS